MSRTDVLNEIEAVRLEGYSTPAKTFGSEWLRKMWPNDATQYVVTLKACVRTECAIVYGGGIEIKCCAGMIQDAADTVAARCKKIVECG